MFLLCVIVSAFLAFLSLGMGSAQRNGVPQATAVMERVGAVKLAPVSGALLMAGGFGVIAGLFWAPIGIAASAGLVVYFLIAAGFHVKVRDSISQTVNPLVPAAIAAVALWLRITTR
jgi:IMP dehydrogenase/GMP reductase